ncbi:hypothetical protein ACLB2K_004535 [Fragaria x ananassa]
MSSRDPYFQFAWDSTVHGEVELEMDDDTLGIRRTTVSPCPVRKANLKNPAGGVGALSILSRLIRSKRLSAPRYYNHHIPRPRGGTPATTKRDFARPGLLVWPKQPALAIAPAPKVLACFA